MNEEKPLYQLEDEDDLPLAYGQENPEYIYNEENIDDDGEVEDTDQVSSSRQSLSPFSALLRVMFGPVTGWKALKRARLKPERMGAVCFVPMVSFAALSTFAAMFYDPESSGLQLTIDTVVTFASYFFGYFLLPLLAAPMLDEKGRKNLDSPFGRNAMMLCFTTLAIFRIIGNVLPVFGPVTVFLPLWTIYMIHRLVPVMQVRKEHWAKATVILSLLVVGLPAAWDYLLSLLLP